MREALLAAAGPLFAERAFGEVSVREVARAADVTPAMVHYYFGGKAGLYEATFDWVLDRMLTTVSGAVARGRAAPDPIGVMLEALVGVFTLEPWIPALVLREVLLGNGRHRRRFVERYASRVSQLVPEIMRAQVRAGSFREGLDPKLAAISLIGMTGFPFLARPVVGPAFGLAYDQAFQHEFVSHTRRLFLEGVSAPGASR